MEEQMTKEEEQYERMMADFGPDSPPPTKNAPRGLGLISDELLAQIVENDIDGYGTLQTDEGRAAFNELARRSS